MNSVNSDDSGLTLTGGDIPTAISSLIDGAVASFDADRNTSRRYLMRASALLRAKHLARTTARDTLQARPPGGLATWQLNRVIDYIETHLAEKITGQDLAGLANLSIGQLFRSFKISVGTPPFRYIALRRFELACTMMKTTREPLSQVAIASGLCDQSHLCRAFQRLTGMSPAVWRRANENEPNYGRPQPHTVTARVEVQILRSPRALRRSGRTELDLGAEKKREGYRRAFDKFDPEKVADYSERPIQRLSKDLKHRGFSVVGPTVTYAYMQAVGMVNEDGDRGTGHPRDVIGRCSPAVER